MQSSDFQGALSQLEKLANQKRCALMCAEGVPRRCYRSLIADALTVGKWRVFHIQSKKTAKLHKRTAFLKVKQGMLTYPYIQG